MMNKLTMFSPLLAALFAVANILITSTACRESPALVKMVEAETTLQGEWYQNTPEDGEYTWGENEYLWASITEDMIEVYLHEETTDFLYWRGTYDEPETMTDNYSWISVNKSINLNTAVYDTAYTKIFHFSEGQISFDMGNQNIELSLGKDSRG